MGNLKRTICIISAFIMTVGMLAGCALFERDVRAYNNLPVATVGNITITKKQLVDGFNNFGYQYEQDQGLSREEALEETLTLLLDREIMVNLALQQLYGLTEDQIAQSRKSDFFPYNELSAREQDSARQAAFDTLNTWYKEIEDEARKSYGMAVNVTGEEEPSSATTHEIYIPFTPFLTTHGVERERVVNNGSSVTTEKYWDTSFRLDVSKFAEEKNIGTVEAVWTPKTRTSTPTGTEKKIAEEAYGSLVRRLKTAETGLTFDEDKDKKSTEVNQNVIAREVKRISNEEAKNNLVSKFRDLFEQGLTRPIDKSDDAEYDGIKYATLVAALGEQGAYEFAVSTRNSNYTEDLAERAAEYYKRQVRTQIDRYRKGQETDSSIGTLLLDNLSSVYYVPESIVNQYFSVSHILVGYSDEQKAELEQIEARLKTNGNMTDYNTSLNALRARTGGYMRNGKGEEFGDFMNAEKILEFVQDYVTPYDKTRDKAYNDKATGNGYEHDVQQVLKLFRDCIYMFNTDPGMINPEFEYVIGLNESRMVDEFTEAARDLYWNAETNRQEGKPGGMSGLVWSQFGAHIIMYTRNIGDFIYHNSLSVLETTFDRYLNATQTSYGDKKYFDTILETLTKPDYDTQEQNLIAGYLEGKTITKINRNFSDLL